MGANAGINPVEGDSPEPNPKPDSSFLLWLARDGPIWARIPASIAGILVALIPLIALFSGSLNSLKAHFADSPAAKELQLAAITDVTGREEMFKSILQHSQSKQTWTPEEQAQLVIGMNEIDHELGHISTPVDEVKWFTFAVEDKKDYFGYKLFPSDRCLLIARVENGFAKVQWLRDPNTGKLPDSPKAPTSLERFSHSATEHLQFVSAPLLKNHPDYDVQAAIANLAFDSHDKPTTPGKPGELPTQQVQGGCLNPHPWAYQENWGPMMNQCQQPIYRRWADGCMHIQVFDHCQNFWGPIVWQYCSANHHP